MALEIEGLEGNYYAVNNPVYLKIQSSKDSFIVMRVQGKSDSDMVYQIRAGLPLFVDISDYIKSFMGIPDLVEPVFAGEQQLAGLVNKNIIELTLLFAVREDMGPTKQYLYKRIFVRGGYFNGVNNQLTDGMVLKDSSLVPTWGGYPSNMFHIQGASIVATSTSSSYADERRTNNTCDSVYIGFLNSKGGFSYWLFDNYELTQKVSSSDTLERNPDMFKKQSKFLSVGGDTTSTLNVVTRAEEDYYRLMRALSASPIVYVYKLRDILDISFDAPRHDWTQIKNNGNSFALESSEDVKEFSFDFDLLLTEKRKFGW